MSLENIDLCKKAKAIFLYQKEEKVNFPQSKAVLLISVGQANHEGEKLAATIKLVNKNFQACDVAVCDTLQRHTMHMSDSSSPEEVYMKSSAEGKKWVERNKESLISLKIPHKIFYWEEYLLRLDFLSCKDKIILAYQKDQNFKAAMNITIQEFMTRYERRSTEIDKEQIANYCFNYLAEECAIMMLMWPKCQYHYIVYPSNMPKALTAARDKFVVPCSPEMLKWAQVYVRSRAISHSSGDYK